MENLTQRLRKLKLDIRIGMEEKQINQDLGIILLDDLEKAIKDTHCCKSDSELLHDVEKKQLIEDAYWLNLQNLSGREDFEEAFKLGIETGVDETIEKLHS
tara:strand:- start:131 stop:433 length:303 start_codon:yes stop_codon:yes gene_type:complete